MRTAKIGPDLRLFFKQNLSRPSLVPRTRSRMMSAIKFSRKMTLVHAHALLSCHCRDFAQKAKSRGGTLVTRAYIKESTYS